jgi:hypothetical protein
MCVRERERDGEGGRERGSMPGRIYDNSIHFIYPVVIFSTVGVFLF